MNTSLATIITSVDDPRLIPYRDLRHRDPVSDSNCFIAEGKLVVERLLRSNRECRSLLVERGHHVELVELARNRNVPIEVLETDLATMRQIVGYDFHRGILACGIRPEMPDLCALKAEEVAKGSPWIVACGVNNPENIGGLMRTAAAFGVTKMAISHDVADPFSRRALRVSMAAALRIEFWRFGNTEAACKHLSEVLGFRTLATTLSPNSTPLASFVADDRPLAILVGSEGDGLPDSVASLADDRLIIPMAAGTDSLNVNVATAIFLYSLLSR